MPAGVAIKDMSLINRLIGPDILKFRRTVGAEDDKWQAGSVSFDNCREIVGNGSSLGTNENGRLSSGTSISNGMKSGPALVEVYGRLGPFVFCSGDS